MLLAVLKGCIARAKHISNADLSIAERFNSIWFVCSLSSGKEMSQVSVNLVQPLTFHQLVRVFVTTQRKKNQKSWEWPKTISLTATQNVSGSWKLLSFAVTYIIDCLQISLAGSHGPEPYSPTVSAGANRLVEVFTQFSNLIDWPPRFDLKITEFGGHLMRQIKCMETQKICFHHSNLFHFSAGFKDWPLGPTTLYPTDESTPYYTNQKLFPGNFLTPVSNKLGEASRCTFSVAKLKRNRDTG